MAYKFQLGSARLSGSTTFEQPLVVEDSFSATSLSASAGLQVGGTVELDGVLDVTAVPAADSFYILDADDGLMKRESMSEYANTIAGDGLAAASGILKVDVSDFAGTGLEDDGSENLRIAAQGAGLGGGAGSTLSVNVDDSGIEVNGSDQLGLKDNGVTLAKLAGITRGSIIVGDVSGNPSLLAKGTAAQFLQSDGNDPSYVSISGQAAIASGGALSLDVKAITDQTEMTGDVEDADELMISDGGTLKRLDFSVLRDAVFNDVSGNATIAAGGTLTIANTAVETAMIADDAVTPAKMSLFDDSLAATDTHILIADGSDYSSFALSGDVTMTNAGVVSIGATKVTDAMINDDVAEGLAGFGLGASGGVLAVQVSGAIVLDNDRLGLSGSLAGKGLMFEGGAESLSSLEVKLASSGGLTKQAGSSQKSLAVDLNGLAAIPDGQLQVGSDFFAVIDDSDSSKTKKESIADLITAVAGNGLAATSGVLSVDASEVADEAVASGDKFVFHDATDDSTKKESIDDIAIFMAGAGLTATSGVLSVTGNNVNPRADGENLTEGYNIFADLSSNASVTLPSSGTSTVGDVVVVKAKNLTGAKIIINSQAEAQKIDGENSVEIESPFGAVTMVYVANDDWRIV